MERFREEKNKAKGNSLELAKESMRRVRVRGKARESKRISVEVKNA